MTEKLVILSLSSYAITLLATSSYIGGTIFRDPVNWLARRLFGKLSSIATDVAYFLECRMCSGFWITLIICYIAGNLPLFLPSYALSYFLATQERN